MSKNTEKSNNVNKEIERLTKIISEKDECIDSLDEELCGVRKFLYEKGLLQEFFTSEFYHDTYNNS